MASRLSPGGILDRHDLEARCQFPGQSPKCDVAPVYLREDDVRKI